MQAHDRLHRIIAAACVTAAVAACQAAGNPRSDSQERPVPPAGAATPAEPTTGGAATPSGPPAGGTSAPAPAGATEGPHEGNRANTPPGVTRDGLPPVGGAIIDPTGAVTGTKPPPAMR